VLGRYDPRVHLASWSLFALLLATTMPSEEQVRAVRTAWIAERSGDVEGARRLFMEAGTTWPDDPYLLDETPRFLDRTGRDTSVQATLRARLIAVLADPSRPLPVAIVRRQILDKGASRDDLELLEKAVSAKLAEPAHEEERLSLLADVQRRLEDADGLSLTLERMAVLRPSHELTWERLSLAVHRQRWPEAKALLDQIGRAGNDSLLYEHIRLLVLAHLGDVEAVLAAAGETTDREARERLVGALQQIGWDLWDAGRERDAETIFRKSLALSPGNVAAAQIVAQLFATPEERAARGSEAEASWSGIDDPTLLLQEGSSRLVAGDAAGAYPLLQRATAALPEEASAWYNLGLAAKKIERWEEAVSALQRALALRADWPPALRALADAQAKSGACPAAVGTARRAAEVDAAHPDPYVTLFHCLQEMGDHAGAQAAKAEHERRSARKP
jgi:tetratricopeptide (TPR) repeat protein